MVGNSSNMIISTFTILYAMVLLIVQKVECSEDEYRLLQELFHRKDGAYNPQVRPVKRLEDKVPVGFEITLYTLINLDEKNQIMKTNVWLRIRWCDYYLRWKMKDHGDIEVVRIQPDKVWKPDIVLLNNADGRFEVSFKSNVLVHHNGWMQWVPCTIYKSSCSIDVTYFPFDEQTCELNFGSWTYNDDEIDLGFYMVNHTLQNFTSVDLSAYEKSGTWEIVTFNGSLLYKDDERGGYSRQVIRYDIKFRRKTLFYTVNLILPCVLISVLSMTVFYLPSDEGEKVSLAISILLALVVFLQVLVTKLLPPSSKTLPLFAKYILFAIIIDSFSILNCIMVLNYNFKTPRTHRMPKVVRLLFFGILPTILCMKRPDNSEPKKVEDTGPNLEARRDALRPKDQSLPDRHHPNCPYFYSDHHSSEEDQLLNNKGSGMSKRRRKKRDIKEELEKIPPTLEEEMIKIAESVRFIAAHLKNEDDYEEVIDDWRYVAFVVDRLLFYIYLIVTVLGTMYMMMTAPHLFEGSIDEQALIDHGNDVYEVIRKSTEKTIKNCHFDLSEDD